MASAAKVRSWSTQSWKVLLTEHGVLIHQAGVEAPYQIGNIERHGSIFKSMLKRIIRENSIVGYEGIENAAAITCTTKNTMTRTGGYSPSQWVLGYNPRAPGCATDDNEAADLGLFQNRLDPTTTFARNATLRLAARRASVREDCGRKVARALLRKSAPAVGKYQVGDVASYYKRDHGWSTAARIIGFEGSKAVWLAHGGVPICAAVDRIRPATAAESLTREFLLNPDSLIPGDGDQQRFIDLRGEDDDTVAGADGNEGNVEEMAGAPPDQPAD
jgi:hypothetical protein